MRLFRKIPKQFLVLRYVYVAGHAFKRIKLYGRNDAKDKFHSPKL